VFTRNAISCPTLRPFRALRSRNAPLGKLRNVITAQAAADPAVPGTAQVAAPAALRGRWALAVAALGGLALAASFPPFGGWPLAAAGPALLVVALHGRSLRGSLLAGLVFGLAFFVPLISWVVNVAWYAWAALAIAEAVVFAVLTIGQRLLLRLRCWPVAVAGWWVATEAIRDRWPWAFPWGRLAMSQAGAPDARWMAIGGAPWLTFLLALTGAVTGWAALRVLASRWEARFSLLTAVVTAGLVLSIGLIPVDPVGHAPTAQVAAIQGDVPRARNLPHQLNDVEVTANHANATLKLASQVRAGRQPAPDIVLWPENSTDIDPGEDPAIYNEIEQAVTAIGRPILVGEVLDNPRRNVGQLWTPGGGPGALYVKRQLVPFGEYIPLRGFISTFTSLPSLQPVNFTPGTKAVVFPDGQIRLGDVICYEVGFDPLVRSEVAAGANLLTVQSNDADFEIDGQSGESAQQVAMARLRAVESDRSVVYVSTTGQSAIIAPDGRVIASSGLWQQAILNARVPLVSYRTLADRIGQWPEYVIGVLTIVALVLAAGIGSRAAGSIRWNPLRIREARRARQ
jgi:apolipoprotein N-acyltransferase